MSGLAPEVFRAIPAGDGFAVAGADTYAGTPYVDRVLATRQEAEAYAARLNAGTAKPLTSRVARDPVAAAAAAAVFRLAGRPTWRGRPV